MLNVKYITLKLQTVHEELVAVVGALELGIELHRCHPIFLKFLRK